MVLDDRLRLALAQGWILGETGQENQPAADALAERHSQHPDFAAMLTDLIENWQTIYTKLQDGIGVYQRTEIAGGNLGLVVLAAQDAAGPVTAGVGFPAHQFITRFTGERWAIAATARRLRCRAGHQVRKRSPASPADPTPTPAPTVHPRSPATNLPPRLSW